MKQEEINSQIIGVLRNATEAYLITNNPLQKRQVISEIEKIESISNPILEPEIDLVELVTTGEVKVDGRIEVQVMESMGNGNSRRSRIELCFRNTRIIFKNNSVSLHEERFEVWSAKKNH